jgi:hypothetical protein
MDYCFTKQIRASFTKQKWEYLCAISQFSFESVFVA